MVICGILKEKEAFDAIWWPIVFMIAALLPISSAMNNSGARRNHRRMDSAPLGQYGKSLCHSGGILFLPGDSDTVYIKCCR